MEKENILSADDLQNFINLHGKQGHREIEWLQRNVEFCREVKNNPIGKVLFEYLSLRIAELMDKLGSLEANDMDKGKMAAYKDIAVYFANKMHNYYKTRDKILKSKDG